MYTTSYLGKEGHSSHVKMLIYTQELYVNINQYMIVCEQHLLHNGFNYYVVVSSGISTVMTRTCKMHSFIVILFIS